MKKKIEKGPTSYSVSRLRKEELPESVKDEKSYYEWRDILGNPLMMEENRFIKTSDPYIEVDTYCAYPVVMKKIVSLPNDERVKIESIVRTVLSLRRKANSLKEKAYGMSYGTGTTRTILDERKGELIELFAQRMTLEEVHSTVVNDWGFVVHYNTIREFRLKNLEVIEEKRGRYDSSLGDINLFTKRSRLRELEWLYLDKKQKYLLSSSKEDYRALVTTLQVIKAEEDKDGKLTMDSSGNINLAIEESKGMDYILNELLKDMTINDIIITRVSSRLGINPRMILHQLRNSFYAKYNGFGVMAGLDEPQDLNAFPSKMVYDFDKMKLQNERLNTENKELIKFEPFEEDRVVVVKDLRTRLLENLGIKKEQVKSIEIEKQQTKQ